MLAPLTALPRLFSGPLRPSSFLFSLVFQMLAPRRRCSSLASNCYRQSRNWLLAKDKGCQDSGPLGGNPTFSGLPWAFATTVTQDRNEELFLSRNRYSSFKNGIGLRGPVHFDALHFGRLRKG